MLAGWSLAVIEALSYYEQFGAESLDGLVLIDGELSFDVPDEDAAGQIQFLKMVVGTIQSNRAAGLGMFVRSMYHNPPPAEHLERVTGSVLATSEDTAIALLVNRIGFSVREGLGKIAVPTLVIVSEKNGSKEKITADAKKIPKVEVEVMAGAGHALFVDKADEFNRVVGIFWGADNDGTQGSYSYRPLTYRR